MRQGTELVVQDGLARPLQSLDRHFGLYQHMIDLLVQDMHHKDVVSRARSASRLSRRTA